MNKPILAPSLLSADFSDLAGAVRQIEQNHASVVHIDVMDGRFVPQISYGQPVVRSIRPLTKLPFDVHLMVEHPEDQVDSFAAAGADWITFHLESTVHVNRLLCRIRELGKKAGISIVPSTPVSSLSEILPLADIVLVMTVNPGFGGQVLIPSCVEKIAELVRIRNEQGLSYMISADGGVNRQTLGSVLSAGADVIVSGSSFFKGELEWERV
jgi:ribulose-phosphate 3-epimerase